MYDDPFFSWQGKFIRQKSSDVFAGNVSISFRTGAFGRHVMSSHNFDTHILPVLAAEIYGRISWWLPQSRCKVAALEGLALPLFFHASFPVPSSGTDRLIEVECFWIDSLGDWWVVACPS